MEIELEIERIGAVDAGVMCTEIAQTAGASGCGIVAVEDRGPEVAPGADHIHRTGERRTERIRVRREDAGADVIIGPVPVTCVHAFTPARIMRLVGHDHGARDATPGGTHTATPKEDR